MFKKVIDSNNWITIFLSQMVFQFVAFSKVGEPELPPDRSLKIILDTLLNVNYISVKKLFFLKILCI